MSFLATLLGNRNAADERWWGAAPSTVAESGVVVNPETALKLSAVWGCVGLLAETIAALPLVMFQRLANGGRERALRHPLYQVLHDQPNAGQTRFEFVEMLTGHALLRGNGLAEIVPGPRGAVDQLLPLHPDRVTVERIPGGKRYRVREEDGRDRVLNDEDVFHLRGLSFDGLWGVSVIEYARESIGLGVATEGFGARFFKNDSRPGGVLRTDKQLSKEAAQRLKTSWESAHSQGNSHRVAVLEEGLQWQAMGLAPEEAQFLETRTFQAEDVARWFRVPPHMIGLTSKATSWGSGIEQLSIGFVMYTLLPWLMRWQQAIARDLIIATDTYFAEFIVDALLRGDTKSRYEAHLMGRNGGWLSVNDIRRMENMNPIENGDVYLEPLNMTEAGTPPAPPSTGRALHYRQLAETVAARIVRKEVAAMSKAARRHEGDATGWQQAVLDFYAEHAVFVATSLHIDLVTANLYVGEQREALLAEGPAAMEHWETQRVAALVALALEEQGD